MNLVALLNRLLGRDQSSAEVTRDEVRQMIRDRQDRQEARLRSLDLQAVLPTRRRRR